MSFKKNYTALRKFDWVLFLIYLSLVVVGLLMIYTTTYHDSESNILGNINSIFGRQLLWAGISLLILFAVYFIDWNFWNSLSLPIYIIGILLLVSLFLFGVEIKGAKSWISLAGFTLQPSEFVKVSTGIYLASVLSSLKINLKEIWAQVFVFGIILLPMTLITLQPDPGTGLTFLSLFILLYRRGLPSFYYVGFFAVFLTLILSLILDYTTVISIILLICIPFFLNFSREKLRSSMFVLSLILMNMVTYQFGVVYYSIILNGTLLLYFLLSTRKSRSFDLKFAMLGYVFALSILSFSSSYAFNNLLKPHQQDRINVWLQPEKCDPRGSLYNLLQSKLAIGSGGVTGKGYLNGALTSLNYVPEQTTDFIFSSIGEEQGFIGGLTIILLFSLLLVRILYIGEKSKYLFNKNFCYVIAGFIFLHFFINIGMTMGISPIIGIPLPFISKGGSSLLAFSIMIGMVLKMNEVR